MDKYLEHETSSYSLHSNRFGDFELLRRCDGASCYFQGDDASLWRRNIDAIVAIDYGDETINSLDRSFDFLCSGYDDVMIPSREQLSKTDLF